MSQNKPRFKHHFKILFDVLDELSEIIDVSLILKDNTVMETVLVTKHNFNVTNTNCIFKLKIYNICVLESICDIDILLTLKYIEKGPKT